MFDPKNPRQYGDHFTRLMTEKMLHHLAKVPRWWHSICDSRVHHLNVTGSPVRTVLRDLPVECPHSSSDIQELLVLPPRPRQTPILGTPWRLLLPHQGYLPEGKSNRLLPLWILRTGHLTQHARSFLKRFYPRIPAGARLSPCPHWSIGRTRLSTGSQPAGPLLGRDPCANRCLGITACTLMLIAFA